MQIRTLGAVSILACASILAGCNPQQSGAVTDAAPGTLMLDLTAVARATGIDEQIKTQLEAATKEVDQQLQNIAAEIRAKVDEEKKKIGDGSTEEQQQKLANLNATANQKMSEMRQRGRKKLEGIKADLVGQLRGEVRTIAESIATDRGADAVMLVSEPMLWFDSKIDITADVVAEMKDKPKSESSEKPQSEAPVSEDNS